MSTVSTPDPVSVPAEPRRAYLDLFLVSFVILFFELACIRWFGSTVVFMTFFTNVVLLACFLGMSVGCLAAGHRRNYLRMTPAVLLVAIAAACGVEALRDQLVFRRCCACARSINPARLD